MRFVLFVALGLFLLPVAQAQTAEIHLGDDAVGDDTSGPLASGSTGYDLTEIDDIVSASIWTEGDAIKFRMTVAEEPGDTVHGQFCWMPAFEVVGQEEEFVGLMCETYTAGSSGGFAEANTNRGTEVASEAVWDGASVVITVPFANINAGPGDILEDIYVMTYGPNQGQNGLYVDDALPDAKSDRAASQSLGCYVIGAGPGDDWSNCEPVVDEAVGTLWSDVDDVVFDLNLSLSADSSSYGYNWSLPAAKMVGFIEANGTGSVAVDVRQNGSSLYNATVEGDTAMLAFGGDMGPVQVFVNTTAFDGTLRVVLEEDAIVTTQGGEGEGGAGETGGETQGNGTAENGTADPDGEDSPAPLAVLALVAAVVLARRRH